MMVFSFCFAYSIANPHAKRDPWESVWRQRVAEVVNRTLLHKTVSPPLPAPLPLFSSSRLI